MMIFFVLLLLGLVPGSLASPDNTPIAARTFDPIPSASPTVEPTWRHNGTRQHKHVHDFFKLFGWIRRDDTIPEKELPNAIKRIQRILREPETGEYDERMEVVMSKPRCGTIPPFNSTDAANGNDHVLKRFVLWGPKWDHTPITYRFINYTADVGTDTQKSIISAAFDQWNQYLPVSIAPAPSTSSRADIHIRFIPMGPNEVAYAFTNMIADGLSMSSGLINVTFNDDYNWKDDRLMAFTALHEIGHALGLSHSKVEDAVMWPYYEGLTRPMHPDDKAAIHSLYGWKDPRWSRIDANSGTKTLAQVSSLSSTLSAFDGLYQLRSTGTILFYTSSGTWTTIDSNKDTVQITGAGGKIYQRHTDGSIYRYSGTASNWQYIGVASENVVDIVAASDQIYQRRKDGWIARWNGTGTTWNTIEQPRSSKQIAITDSKTIWNLLTTGDLVRSTWPYGNGWTLVNQDPLNTQIAVGGDQFYKLQSDGKIVWLDNVAYYWVVIEDNKSVYVYAAGNFVYSKHADSSIWRYTGTPYVWEMLDSSQNTVSVIGDTTGAVFQMKSTGEVLKLVT